MQWTVAKVEPNEDSIELVLGTGPSSDSRPDEASAVATAKSPAARAAARLRAAAATTPARYGVLLLLFGLAFALGFFGGVEDVTGVVGQLVGVAHEPPCKSRHCLAERRQLGPDASARAQCRAAK